MTFPAIPPAIGEAPIKLKKSNIEYSLACVEEDNLWHAKAGPGLQVEVQRTSTGFRVRTDGYASSTPSKDVSAWSDVEGALFEA